MFVSIRVYENAVSKEKIAGRVKDGFVVPHGRQLPGFRGWYSFDAGNGKIGSVTLFDNEEAAVTNNERASAWVRDNDLAELLPDAPEIIVGKVIRSVVP